MATHVHPRGLRPLSALSAAVALVLALGACGDDADSGEDTGTDSQADVLIDKTFVSTSVEGHDLVADTAIQVAFTDEAMAVSAGCNTMTAGWVDDAAVIAWDGPVASTMMMCSPDLDEQDQWLNEIFTEGLNVVDGDADLTLEGDDLTIELEQR